MAGCTGRLHGVVREAVPIKETTGCIIVQMKHPAFFDLIFWPAVVATEGKNGSILEPGFHPVGVHIVAAEKQFAHGTKLS